MTAASSERSAWAGHALERLSEAGFRSGGARRAVVELLGRQSCCLTAQEIFEAVRAEGRPVGIASVYRVLDLLSEQRLVQRVDVGGTTARYELALPTGEHHHHVVCDDCGKVEPFTDVSLERAISVLPAQLGYDIVAHEVVLRGECADCRAA